MFQVEHGSVTYSIKNQGDQRCCTWNMEQAPPWKGRLIIEHWSFSIFDLGNSPQCDLAAMPDEYAR